MEPEVTNVNLLTFMFALRREGGVFAALHAAPVWGELVPVRVEAVPFGPLTEAAQAELNERLAAAFKAAAREARLEGK
jgi:hypothetical protein